MQRFDPGERVRIDIPDESDPDHQQYHGTHGEIVGIIEDSVDQVTSNERDAIVYRVALEDVTMLLTSLGVIFAL